MIDREDNKIISINLDLNSTQLEGSLAIDTEQAFFTSDKGTCYLEFISNMDLIGATAELVLTNIDDKSVVQRSFEITEIPFNYKLTDREVERAGRWVCQIVVERDFLTLTNIPFMFEILGHILDTGEPILIDFSSFDKIKNQMVSLLYHIQNMSDEALKFTAAETVRNQNEAVRISNESGRVISDAGRQAQIDALSNKFQELLDEMEGKDSISLPEITAARKDSRGVIHESLKQRLDFNEIILSELPPEGGSIWFKGVNEQLAIDTHSEQTTIVQKLWFDI